MWVISVKTFLGGWELFVKSSFHSSSTGLHQDVQEHSWAAVSYKCTQASGTQHAFLTKCCRKYLNWGWGCEGEANHLQNEGFWGWGGGGGGGDTFPGEKNGVIARYRA